MTKRDERIKSRKIRDSVPKTQKAEYDRKITEKILSLPEFSNARNILLFASTGSEFDTREIFRQSLLCGKNVYFPKCGDFGIMEFYNAEKKDDFELGKYGIYAPKSTEKYDLNDKNTLVLVPALAVGRDFSRLGYGGGYYDRFLKDFDGIKVCPVYDILLSETVPTEIFDIPQDIIITQNEILRR